MSQLFHIHPDDPQQRLLSQAAKIIHNGGVIVYPTDSAYALGCHIGDKDALTRIRQLRELDKTHHFTLVCRDLSELATYARVEENRVFRILKRYTPGPYTFLLRATREVPKRLLHTKRKTIGLRVPNHVVTQKLLETLNEPLMSTTLIFPTEIDPINDMDEIQARLNDRVDLIIDAGYCDIEPTTVIDLISEPPQILRQGKGIAQL